MDTFGSSINSFYQAIGGKELDAYIESNKDSVLFKTAALGGIISGSVLLFSGLKDLRNREISRKTVAELAGASMLFSVVFYTNSLSIAEVGLGFAGFAFRDLLSYNSLIRNSPEVFS